MSTVQRSKNRRKRVAHALSLKELLDRSQWHSSLSFDAVFASGQHMKNTLKNSPRNRAEFIPAGSPSSARFASQSTGQPGELLIRKADRALWRVSDDGKRIEPAFSDDIITIGEEK
jgi:hypothetical protein